MSSNPLLVQLWLSDGRRAAHHLLLEHTGPTSQPQRRSPLEQLQPRWPQPRRPVWVRLDLHWAANDAPPQAAVWESWLRQEVLAPLGIPATSRLQQIRGANGLRFWLNRAAEASGGSEALRAWLLRRQVLEAAANGSTLERLRWLLCLLQLERHSHTRSGAAWPAAIGLARTLLNQMVPARGTASFDASAGARLLGRSDGQPLRGGSAQLLAALAVITSQQEHDLFARERQELSAGLGALDGSPVADWRVPQLLAAALTGSPGIEATLLATTEALGRCRQRRSSARLWLLAALQQQPEVLQATTNPAAVLTAVLQPLQGGARDVAWALAAALQQQGASAGWRQQALQRALGQQCQASSAIRWPDPQAALGGWPPPAALKRQIRPAVWRAPLAGLVTLQHLEAPTAP